jgi:hypothetical protein
MFAGHKSPRMLGPGMPQRWRIKRAPGKAGQCSIGEILPDINRLRKSRSRGKTLKWLGEGEQLEYQLDAMATSSGRIGGQMPSDLFPSLNSTVQTIFRACGMAAPILRTRTRNS